MMMEEEKQGGVSSNSPDLAPQQQQQPFTGDFEQYLIQALNESLIKKNEIKSLRFESWWVEAGVKNQISIIFKLDGNPHEVIIKDTKYYVKELYSADKKNTNQLTCWDLFVGAKIDVFGKSTELKQSDLKTTEWNRFYASFLTEMKSTFLEELRKYERKQMDTRITRQPTGRHAASANLRELINQVVCLKQRMAGFRPLLSDDIVVAFESLL